jgi:hypothetical protein
MRVFAEKLLEFLAKVSLVTLKTVTVDMCSSAYKQRVSLFVN